MKIAFWGMIEASDSTCPLIRTLQNKGMDIYAFFTISPICYKSPFLSFNGIKPKAGIYKASEFEELAIYSDYMDLNRVFIVNTPYCHSYDPRLWWFTIKVFSFIKKLRANIFHFEWQLYSHNFLLYLLPLKYTMTVHDPISHSSSINSEEFYRKIAFRRAKKYMLLSHALENDFKTKYGIPSEKIFFSHMGEFDFLNLVKPEGNGIKKPFILFWGRIASNKGIDVLCKAMTLVHKQIPDLRLVVAGKGDFYFDFSPYQNLDYIILKHEFISIPALSGLLKDCLFAVVPYIDATQSGVAQTAFSVDVPLIVTNVGDLPQSVTDGITGLVIPPKDSESLAEAIIKLANNPIMLEDYKKNINSLWKPSMQWDEIGDDFVSMFKSVNEEL